MSNNQIYRGDPERKILYLVDDFSGGINVVDIDGVVKDNEFRKLVNVELVQKGLAQNRKGFKYLNMFDELLNDLSLTLPSSTHLFKIIRDKGNLLEKLIDFSFIDVQEAQEDTEWTYIPTSQTLTLADFYNSTSGEIHDFCALIANAYGIYSLVINNTATDGVFYGDVSLLKKFNKVTESDIDILETTVEIPNPYITYDLVGAFASYDYFKLTIDYGGETNFFIAIDSNTVKNTNLFDVVGIDVTVVRDDLDGLTITNNTGASIYYYWTGINVKPTKTNIKTVDYGDKVYFSTSDIINSEDAIVVYDVLTNSVSYIDKDNYYEPNAYDIMNFAKDLGFNMLASNPISAIDTVDTTLKTFQTIWITNTSGQLLPKIPKNGQFVINLLTTGSTLSPYEVKITLKNHLDEELVYTTYSVSSDGAVFKYTFDGASITGFSDALALHIDINWHPLDIEVDGLVNVSPKFYPESVVDNSIIYIIENDSYYKRYSFGNGYTFASYGLLDIETSVEDGDPFTADPTSLFAAYMSATYSAKYFEIYNAVSDEKILYQYQNFGTTFVPVYRSDVGGFTFETVNNVCPLKYSIFKDTITNKYYVVTAVSSSSITYSEIVSYNENELILPLLGQEFEIGTSAPQTLTGIDLADIHILEINGRMIYYKENIIWFSDSLGNFDYIPNNNFEILPINVNDEIVSINFFRGSYIIFTKNCIYKMGNYDSSEFAITLVSDFVGAISPNSIRAIENSLYFLSKKGLYRLVLNYYVESYENIQKVDEKINGEIIISEDTYSLLYNGQYWLIYNNEDIDTIKYYYNIELSNKRHPFTFDIYAQKPDLLIPHNLNLFSIKDNRLYVYDSGYTDFYYDDSLDIDDYIPVGEIELSNYLLGTPTHDKKFKSIYIKTYCDRIVPLYLTVKIDGYTKIDPNSYVVSVSPTGEVLYNIVDASNLELKKDLLGNFIIGDDKLGDGNQSVHKLVVASKGKAIQLNIKFKTQNYFGIANIGILYKLGKVKENR